jgi:hypothetical protein
MKELPRIPIVHKLHEFQTMARISFVARHNFLDLRGLELWESTGHVIRNFSAAQSHRGDHTVGVKRT